MWPHNEADIDLLNFGYLIDGLEIVLTEPPLLRATVGVAGTEADGSYLNVGAADDTVRYPSARARSRRGVVLRAGRGTVAHLGQ
jgi:hypothetical protein